MTIAIKRVYEPASRADGARFLVDRLWPRGIKKTELQMDAWLKDAAPSSELRKWVHADPERWPEFAKRYRKELALNPAALGPIREAAKKGPVTLLYAARDPEQNHARVLAAYLARRHRGL